MDNLLKIISGVAILISLYFYWDLFTINRIMFTASVTSITILVASMLYLTKSGETSTFVSAVDRLELLAVIIVTVLALTMISASSVIII